MDSKKIIEIVNQYKDGLLSLEMASFHLVVLGLNADEVIKVLNM